MANPPPPVAHTSTKPDSPITFGTILHYGVNDITVTGLLVDSYKRSAKYAKVDEIVGQAGIVTGVRMSDFRAEVRVTGRILNADTFVLKPSDILTINGDNILITTTDLNASATGFSTIDVGGTSYEGVSGLEPA